MLSKIGRVWYEYNAYLFENKQKMLEIFMLYMSTQDDLSEFDQQMDADFQKIDIALIPSHIPMKSKDC